MFLPLLIAFLGGVVSLALVQICAAFLLVQRLLHPRSLSSSRSSSLSSLDAGPSVTSHIFLKGDLWVAAAPPSLCGNSHTKVLPPKEKQTKDYKRKNFSFDDSQEISPTRRHATLEDQMLTLIADDGSEEHIDMTGCSVVTVSGGKEASTKWAKKYPIKLESRDQKLFAGSSICLIYAETGWEKETWCHVLRAACRWNSSAEDWYIAQKGEFHEYCLLLDKAYPAFQACSSSTQNHANNDKGIPVKPEIALSRRQKFMKKLAKLGSSRGNVFVSRGSSDGDLKKTLLETKSGSGSLDLKLQARTEDLPQQTASDLRKVFSEEEHSLQGSRQQNLEYAFNTVSPLDQGSMCWNVLFSRLFFDSYHSSKFQAVCHKLIQRQLSKIVTPSYIGGINCTSLELGTMPPFFHSMKIVPKESDFIWSFEAGVEYSGGAQIKIETRLDAHEYMSQQNLTDQVTEATLSEAAAAEILKKGLESVDGTVEVDVSSGDSAGKLKRFADSDSVKDTGNNASVTALKGGWKGMLSRVADHVSQVPITLSLRVVSLRGTLRVQIKPPPTDRIWFGFTSMPNVDLQPEPFVGDYRITTGPIVTFITQKIKMLIQDNLVLPNCEGIWVPWMISENDDWIPRTAMPAPWIRVDSHESLPREEAQVSNGSAKSTRMKETDSTLNTGKKDALSRSLPTVSAGTDASYEIETPPLDHSVAASEQEASVKTETSQTTPPMLKSLRDDADEDRGSKSRRTKMLILGKKVGEKLDEKRRLVLERVREGFEKHEQGGRS